MALASDMIGQKLRHFEILDKIGAGGMGEVYLARDTQLGRNVALKVVPESTARDAHQLVRFQNEARALASLNHPNIVTIHAVEQVEGTHYLAMELVVGQTLDQLIPEGGLPLSKLLKISLPLVDALASAHAHGIVHRDLKPRNIMVTEEGRVKVLDFGLAKQVAPALSELEESQTVPVTASGNMTVTGTVPYMAPERLHGKETGPTSDVFSLGVLIFEMATGRRPWRGANLIDLAVSIMRDPAPDLDVSKQGYDQELQAILKVCLDKDPKARYPSARQLHEALSQLESSWLSETLEDTQIAQVRKAHRPKFGRLLSAVGGALLVVIMGFSLWPADTSPASRVATTAQSSDPMIVILPFRNLGAAEDAYFSAGISEEITSRLALVDGLRIISRTSSMQYADTDKTSQQIGDELGVDYILSGTVRWSKGTGTDPDRVRITPQLVQVADDSQLWSRSYDKVLEDIFQVQTELALQVIDQLGVNILPQEQAAIETLPTESPAAAQAFRRGQDFDRDPEYTPENAEFARREYEQAATIDPQFARAWSSLAETHAQMIHFGHDRSPERYALAQETVQRAQELAPEAPETIMALGYYHYWVEKNYTAARREFQRVARNHPDRSRALAALAYVDRRLGAFAPSLAGLEKALVLDPQNTSLIRELGNTNIFTGDRLRAYRYLDRAIELAPNVTHTYLTKVQAIWRLEGDLGKSRNLLNSLPPEDHPLTRWCLYWQAMYEGDPEAALEALETTDANFLQWNTFLLPVALLQAQAYEQLGQTQDAEAAYRRSEEVLRTTLATEADDPRHASALGLTLAGLGQADAATERGRQAVEDLPTHRDAIFGPPRRIDLALIYVKLGRYDEAVAEIQGILERPGQLTPHILRLDPRWRPLDGHPGFAELAQI